MTATPDTIVLIHGFWVTPRSWEDWEALRGPGVRRPAPAYPGFEVEVEALNPDPSPIEEVTVPAVMTTSVRRRGARALSDPDGSLGRRSLYAAPPGSRLRGGGRGNQLGADRRRQASCRWHSSGPPSPC